MNSTQIQSSSSSFNEFSTSSCRWSYWLIQDHFMIVSSSSKSRQKNDWWSTWCVFVNHMSVERLRKFDELMTNSILSMSWQRTIRVKHLTDWSTRISSIWRQVNESKELKIRNKDETILSFSKWLQCVNKRFYQST
jgi:hypothetical protein